MKVKSNNNRDDTYYPFFANSMDLLCITDKNGGFVNINPQWGKILGYSTSDIIKKLFIEFVHPEDVGLSSSMLQLTVSQPNESFINRFKHKNNSYQWIEWNPSYSREKFFITGRVITVNKDYEKKLKEIEERNRHIISLTTDYVFKFDVDANNKLKLVYTSANFETVTGRTLSEMQGFKNMQDFFHPDDIGSVNLFIKQLLTEGLPKEIECRSKVKDKSRWIQIIAKPIQNENTKQVTSILGAVKDITDRKTVEEKLRFSEEKFLKAFLSSPYAVSITNFSTGLYVDVNDIFLKQSGFQRKEVIGKHLLDLNVWEDPAHRKLFLGSLEDNKPIHNLETQLRSRSGAVKDCLVSAELIEISSEKYSVFFIQDITEKKKEEKKFKQLANLNETILDTINVGLAYVKERKTQWSNNYFHQLFGYEYSEIINTDTLALYNNIDEYNKVGKEGYDIISKGGIYNTEVQLKKKNGTVLWINLAGKAINPEKPMDGSIWMTQDIDERKKAEKEFKQLAELNQTILDTITAGLIFVKDQIIQWTNSVCAKMYGYKLTEIIGKDTAILYGSIEDFRSIGDEAYKQLEKGKIFTKELLGKKKNGTLFWCYLVGNVINPKNISQGTIWVIQDITERKNSEITIRQNEAKLRSIFKAAPVAIGLTVNRFFYECNDTFYWMLGYSPKETINNSARIVYPDENEYNLIGEAQQKMMKNHAINTVESRWKRKDGRIINVLMRFVALDPNDHSKGVAFSAMDITARKQAEEEIIALNLELERKVEERTEKLKKINHDLESFSYSISHDLRAPVRHINGFINLLYSNIPQPTETISGYYNKILSASDRMSCMIDSLLSFSRLGRQELSFSEVDLGKMIHETIEEFKPDIGERNILWKISPLPIIDGDASLLKHAFENLISNAIKYTTKQQEAVISILADEISQNQVEIIIKDNGIGFNMDYSNRLFGVFQRITADKDFEGIGIGLANVKQIIEKHNGKIRAFGEINKGATFYMTLPKKQ